MLSYQDRLAQSKEQKDAAGNQARVRETQLNLDMTILNQEGVVNNAASRVESALNNYPVDWNEVISARQSSAIATDNLAALVELRAGLFPATA